MRIIQVTRERGHFLLARLSLQDSLHGCSAHLTSSSPGAQSLSSPHSHTLISPEQHCPSLEGAPLIPSLQREISPTPMAHSPDSPLILSSKGGCGGAKFIEKRLGRQGRGGYESCAAPRGAVELGAHRSEEAFGEEYRRGKKQHRNLRRARRRPAGVN